MAAWGWDVPELERAGEPQQVLPVPGDEPGVDAVAGERVRPSVVGAGVDAPEPGAADVGEPRAELLANPPLPGRRSRHQRLACLT